MEKTIRKIEENKGYQYIGQDKDKDYKLYFKKPETRTIIIGLVRDGKTVFNEMGCNNIERYNQIVRDVKKLCR